MTLFNLGRWIAGHLTGSGDRDMKVYIIGPAGSGKSKTALALAMSIAKWLSWHIYGDIKHTDKFFKLDKWHLAVIDGDDLITLMTSYPPRFQVRVVDDCGNTRGFNARRSMSREAEDINSIWSTNRTRRCCTIVTLHDLSFSDLRQALLSDVVIDLRDYVQQGSFRMAKLYKIKMGSKRGGDRGVKLSVFATYDCGRLVTQERIACMMPSDEICREYDKIRAEKDRKNTEKVYEKYSKKHLASTAQPTPKRHKVTCPYCDRKGAAWRVKTKDYHCFQCGKIWTQTQG